MYELEIIDGKTYQKVPVVLNGYVLRIELVEVDPTLQTPPADSPVDKEAEIAAEAQPVQVEDPVSTDLENFEETPRSLFTPNSLVNAPRVLSELADLTAVDPLNVTPRVKESLEAEILDEPVCSSTDDADKIIEELISEPIAKTNTVETDFEADETDNSDACSSSGSETEQSEETSEPSAKVELDTKEFPVLCKKVEEAQKKFAFTFLDNFDLDNNLQTPDGLYLINVDGHYVFNKDDVHRFYDNQIHRMLFSNSPQNVAVRNAEEVPVCYKPVYKTVKNVQVRTGPGSAFEKAGVISANEEVVVIQEGLLSCDLKLVSEWMRLHLNEVMLVDFKRSSTLSFEAFIERNCYDLDCSEDDDLIELFMEHAGYDSYEQNVFKKAVAAANRKVKVMFYDNGVQKFGWISKKKNSGPLIRRVFGKPVPSVVVSAVDTMPAEEYIRMVPHMKSKDADEGSDSESEPEPTFVTDCMEFIKTHTKNTTHKDWTGKEKTTTKHAYPPMSFYKDLAKAEIRALIGSAKTRFNLNWEGTFNQARFYGLEKEYAVCNDGKKRLRTGYYAPNDYFTISFQKYTDAKAFLEADFDDTRLSNANVSIDSEFENLRPVDAFECPEYRQFERETRNKRNDDVSRVAHEMGISFTTM